MVVDVLSRLLDSSKPLGVPNQTVGAWLLFVEAIWMQEMKIYLETGQMLENLNLIQK